MQVSSKVTDPTLHDLLTLSSVRLSCSPTRWGQGVGSRVGSGGIEHPTQLKIGAERHPYPVRRESKAVERIGERADTKFSE